MPLTDQIAIVTGASRGIGRAIALALANDGASLVINGNHETQLNEVASVVESLGPRCIIQRGDVADPQTASKLAHAAMTSFGRIDILVNNAGINMRSPTLETKPEDWQKVLNINLNGTLYCCQAVLPFMIERKYGKIVNVSSSSAKTPHRVSAPSYGASKAAVNYLTQHLALEMAKHNIYVNAVCPGAIETDMSQQWPPGYREQLLSRIPLAKIGTPQDVAEAVLFLASQRSDFITGETINLNGGAYMN